MSRIVAVLLALVVAVALVPPVVAQKPELTEFDAWLV